MLEKLPAVVGRSLRRIRPGLGRITSIHERILAASSISLTSPSFGDGEMMPARFTADGEGVSPPLRWGGVPEGTRSLALIVEDADSPTPSPLVHAIVTGLPPVLRELEEGQLVVKEHYGPTLGRNSYLRAAWLPPDPPPGHGMHRYVFQLFALDHDPDLGAHPGRTSLIDALHDHVLARGVMMGVYQR